MPIVNFLTAPFYLFDPMDTMDKIHRPSLVPVTRAALSLEFGELTGDAARDFMETMDAVNAEPGAYRRRFRVARSPDRTGDDRTRAGDRTRGPGLGLYGR